MFAKRVFSREIFCRGRPKRERERERERESSIIKKRKPKRKMDGERKHFSTNVSFDCVCDTRDTRNTTKPNAALFSCGRSKKKTELFPPDLVLFRGNGKRKGMAPHFFCFLDQPTRHNFSHREVAFFFSFGQTDIGLRHEK